MTTNQREFRKWDIAFTRVTKNMAANMVRDFQRKVGLDLFSRIVLRSPVGNPDLWKGDAPPGYVGGQFRGSWQVSVNVDSVSFNKVQIDKSGQNTIARETQAILSAPPFSIIYIINPLPYAQRLENGWSTQAPLGVVEVSVNDVLSGLN